MSSCCATPREPISTALRHDVGAGWRTCRSRSRPPRRHGAAVLFGLGATDAAQTDTYLLPVDAERYREERSGYPLASLYATLGELGAKSVLVLLEAEFGRDRGAYVLPPNIPETMKSVLPDGPPAA